MLAIIPARGGSKGIPHKNISLLAGKPLITYTIEASLQSKFVTTTIVSTDDENIANIACSYGARVIKRPASLAQDKTPTEPVINHVLKAIKDTYHHIVLLQPTSPLRTALHIDNAYQCFLDTKCDSLLSVCSSHYFLWKQNNSYAKAINYDYMQRPRRQDLLQYRENGAIYIFKRELFLKNQNRLNGKISLFEMDENCSIEIDTLFDLFLAEQLFNFKK